MTLASFVDTFRAFAANGGRGPEWLHPLREAAIGRFEQLGFPTTRNEDWHYTSVAPIVEDDFLLLTAPGGEVQAADLVPFSFATDWPTLVFVNGRFSPRLSHGLDKLPGGVRVTNLATAWTDDPAFVERYLARAAGFEHHAFTALNTAFMQDGALVHIPADVRATTPIHLLFVSDADAARGVAFPRNLLVADRHSEASVVESYVALGEAHYFNDAVTEVHVGEGATLHHVRIQRESRRAFHIGTVEARQARDSHYLNFSFATGAALSRVNVYTHLLGPGCGSTLNGLYMVDGEQHCDHQTLIEHVAPNCFSREHYKGLLDGASTAVFNGKVYVHAEAQQTDGKQQNNNLLLSERAHVDAKPQLEIFADDVKCTHGATVGRIDETALFYMKSRGVAADTARRLLTYAFAAEVLETIAADQVREALEALTLSRFTAPEV